MPNVAENQLVSAKGEVDGGQAARQIVHIIGSGHSGSTLLDMMLGGHSQVSSLGEAHSLYFLLRNHTEGYRCTCGKHVSQCAFWAKVEDEAQRILDTSERPALASLMVSDPRLATTFHNHQVLFNAFGQGRENIRRPWEKSPYRSTLSQAVLVLGSAHMQKILSALSADIARQRRIARDTVCFYDVVRRAHGTPVIVDSTKNPGTFKNVFLHADSVMRFILLIRDGRAVCRSRMKRENLTMEQAAYGWKIEHLKRRAAQFTVPRKLIFNLRYEDLASRPEEALRRVCDFLGLQFEDGMMDFRADRHNLGGNPMRFRNGERSIRLDEAWRHELTAADLQTFDRVAGKVNRSLGYV